MGNTAKAVPVFSTTMGNRALSSLIDENKVTFSTADVLGKGNYGTVYKVTLIRFSGILNRVDQLIFTFLGEMPWN